MRRFPLWCCLLLAAHAGAQTPPGPTPRTPPAEGCLDARQVGELHQADPRTLAIATAQGRHFRLQLGSDCPGIEQDATAQLLAADGWLCGQPREFVRTSAQLCPVAAVQPIAAREYAMLARAGDRDEVATLAAVQVQGERRRGFGGSSAYCFNPRQLRSWHEDAQGLVVEVAPRRSGGHRYYRVELAQRCSELDGSPSIQFESGMGLNAICGNPGDRVVALDEIALAANAASVGPNAAGDVGPQRLGRLPRGNACRVAAVYPRDDGTR